MNVCIIEHTARLCIALLCLPGCPKVFTVLPTPRWGRIVAGPDESLGTSPPHVAVHSETTDHPV